MSWLDTGDNAWQMTAASLVALQSVPGLMVLYGGIVKKKWAVNSAFMALYAFASVLVCWVIIDYKAGFGKKMLPFVGVPGPVLKITQEIAQADMPAFDLTTNFPLSTMIYFQFVFAAITVVIIAGAVLCRMNFLAWAIFCPLWLTLSYTVGAFSLWGGGFLTTLGGVGVIDYSGGYVIHVSSGTAGFVASYWVGPRLQQDRDDFRPNNLILALVGVGILWTGWNGFNGGDPYAASADAGVAVLNTNITTAVSLLTWTALDVFFFKKPSIVGAVQGIITGLVAITPAAGFVDGWGAIIIGLASGSIPWVSMNIFGKTFVFDYADDVMGVFHTHLVAGFLGGFLTGIFATSEGCVAFGSTSPGGAIAGNGTQVWVQIVGFLFIVGWNLVWTSIICNFIRIFVPLRMSEEKLLIGDDAVHGEIAYAFGPDEGVVFRHGRRRSRRSSSLEAGGRPNEGSAIIDDDANGSSGLAVPAKV